MVPEPRRGPRLAPPHLALQGLQARTSERRTPSGVPGVTSELRLADLGRELQGAYRCHASNDFGQDEAVVHLAVKGEY